MVLILGQVSAQDKPAADKAHNPRQMALHYNFGHIGHNLSLNYNHYFGRHAINGGVKFHLANEIHNRDSRFDGFRFKPYADKNSAASRAGGFRGRIGLNLGYNFRLIRAESWLTPYLFYQLQATFSLPASSEQYQTGSYTVFENAFGLGIQPVLWDWLRLDVGAGIGPVVFFDETGQITAPSSPANPTTFQERLILLRLGVVYDL
jgi:hypothetical protein